MQETRVSRLLRDARAHVAQQLRPETPIDLARQNTSRGTCRTTRRLSSAADFAAAISSSSSLLSNGGRPPLLAVGGSSIGRKPLPSLASASTAAVMPMGTAAESAQGKISPAQPCTPPVTGVDAVGTSNSTLTAESAEARSPVHCDVHDDAFMSAVEIAQRLAAMLPGDGTRALPPNVGKEVVDLLGALGDALKPFVPMQLPPTSVLRTVYQWMTCDASSEVCRVKTASILMRSLRTPPQAALRVLHDVCRDGGANSLRDDLLYDPVVQLLAAPSVGGLELPAVLHALAIVRYASTESAQNVQSLVTMGAIPALAKALSRLTSDPVLMNFRPSSASSQSSCDAAVAAGDATAPPMCHDAIAHVLVAVRNFSGEFAHHVVKFGLVDLILDLFGDPQYVNNGKLCAAGARALSRLSACEEALDVARKRLASTVAALSIAMDQQKESSLTLPRLSYFLSAALYAVSADVVEELVQDYAFAIDILVLLLLRTTREGAVEAATSLACGLANLSLREAGGRYLLYEGGIMPVLAHLLQSAEEACGLSPIALHAMMCLSNLSYYWREAESIVCTEGGQRGIPRTMVDVYLDHVGPALAALVLGSDVEGAVEATRALGNVSATISGRIWLESTRLDEACVLLASHKDERLVFNCLGVLVNLSSETNCRIPSICSEETFLTRLSQLVSLDDGEETREMAQLARQLRENLKLKVPL